MEVLRKLFGQRRPTVALPEEVNALLEPYLALTALPTETHIDDVRFVVLDIATSGLNVETDCVTSIAAVVVQGGYLQLQDAIYLDLDAARQKAGFTIERDLAHLLAFLGNAPVVAYPAPFVHAFLQPLFKASLGVEFAPAYLDLCLLLPELFREHGSRQLPLDHWLDCFGIEADGRQDPLVDALAEAKLWQVLLARAKQREILSLAQLSSQESARHWLRPDA